MDSITIAMIIFFSFLSFAFVMGLFFLPEFFGISRTPDESKKEDEPK